MSLREKIKLSASSVGAPVPTASFYSETDPVAKLGISLNRELTMSAGNASLGHACVSPARVEDHSTPDPETCASTNLGHSIHGAEK